MRYLADVRAQWVVEIQADEGASARDAVCAWAHVHQRHIIDTTLDAEAWPPLPSKLPCVVIQQDKPSHKLPPWPCSVQFVLTAPGAVPLAQAQHCVQLPSIIPTSKIHDWIRTEKLPAGTPDRATVAQVLPILRHTHVSGTQGSDKKIGVPAPSEVYQVAPTYMYD